MKHHFFKDSESLDQFTMELDRHRGSLKCRQCFQSGQFVSHGYIYRQLTQTIRMAVGKRIFCSKRHGRTGCGRTLRLHLATFIPAMRYDTTHLVTFLDALINGSSIQKAYQAATHTEEPRNAYRWLQKLQYQLINYHSFLKTRMQEVVHPFRLRTRRLQILLPTIQRLFAMIQPQPGYTYQLQSQASLL